jgi:hypothetical protein
MKPKTTEKSRRLTMRVAGGLVKLLGLQMYSGAVPAIAELISNSWDAVATNVRIKVPLGRPLTPEDEIVVSDDGHGMSFDQCNDEYLVVGRDRRRDEGDLSRSYKGRRRPLMSRKGIGKLAGFGIAHRLEVRTVHGGRVTHFALDYNRIVAGGKFIDKYTPELLADDGKVTKDPNGATIRLTDIQVTRSIPEDQFRSSMARRFTILTGKGDFHVFVNKKELKRSEQPFQFRYPDKKGGWFKEDVPGAGRIRWWVGFRKEPIDEEEARGITVFARSKLAQSPWFFGISGGVHGQHGMQYMTGEVEADFLDVTGGPDLIATDRGSVLWEDPRAGALKEWGEKKVKKLLAEWGDKRKTVKVERPVVRRYLELAERLPPQDRALFQKFVERIASIPQLDKDEEILDELVRFGYNALTNHRFLEVIRQLNSASPADRDKVAEIVSEWDIMEAIQTAQKVKGRVEIIRKFREMIDQGVPEKPDMHEFLRTHPWLVNPQWEMLHHEKSLDTLLVKQFGAKATKTPHGKKRTDFFCLASSRQYEVVELKRPGQKVGQNELDQIRDYVFFLKEHADKTNDPASKVDRVGGILVYSDMKAGMRHHINALYKEQVYVQTWDTLLKTTEELHREFLDVVKGRAPAGDPRIKALGETNDE